MLLFAESMSVCVDQKDALLFDSIDKPHPNAVRGPFTRHWPGTVRLALDWELKRSPQSVVPLQERAETGTM
jgi:hypothetical protein